MLKIVHTMTSRVKLKDWCQSRIMISKKNWPNCFKLTKLERLDIENKGIIMAVLNRPVRIFRDGLS